MNFRENASRQKAQYKVIQRAKLMRKLLMLGLGILLVSLIVLIVRIVQVNSHAFSYEIEEYRLGQVVSLKNAFMDKPYEEQSWDFEVGVDDVQYLSEKEFYEAYVPDQVNDGLSSVPGSIIELSVRIKNLNDEYPFFFSALDQALISRTTADTFVMDEHLSNMYNGIEGDKEFGGYLIPPGVEVKHKLFYVLNTGGEWKNTSHAKEDLYLLLSRAPKRVIVNLSR